MHDKSGSHTFMMAAAGFLKKDVALQKRAACGCQFAFTLLKKIGEIGILTMEDCMFAYSR